MIREKKVITFGVAFILLVFLSAGYLMLVNKSHEGKVSVIVKTVPSDATITIDNKIYKNGNFYFKPGSYDVEVKKKGFTTYSETSYFDETKHSVIVIMQAESSEAKEWVNKNQSESYAAQILAEKQTIIEGNIITKKNPILTKLPYKTFQYTIGYIVDQSDPSGNSIIVTIYASETYRQSALYRIYQLGFDPTDLNIVFKDYENPFPL